jgi:hypothetical protein
MAIDINIPIEDSVTDGSLNPVTSNAVFDGLALKANSADLATVATTGDYNDLSNLPTIPAAQVNADWNATSGVAEILNKPTIPSVTNFVPYTGATNDVDLGVHDLTATQGTFATSGNPDTLTVNHSSGSGKALTITKGGNGEGVYVNKTSGSGNAVTVIGDLEATNLKRTGGTSAQFLKANGSIDSTSYQPTLVSGTNIKTINGNSLLGSGDLVISGGGGITVGTTAVTSGTVGRVFFQGTGDVVQQSGSLFWDNTNARLGVGATPASTARLDVRAQGALSTDIAFRVRNSADTANLMSVQGDGVLNLAHSSDISRIAINATTSGQAAIAIGSGNSGLRTVSVGYNNDASGSNGVVIGQGNTAAAAGGCGIIVGYNNNHPNGTVVGKSNTGAASLIFGNLNAIGGSGPTNNRVSAFGNGMTETSGNAKMPHTFMFGSYDTTGNKAGLSFRSNNLNHLLLGYDIMSASYSNTTGTNWIGIANGTAPSGSIDAFQQYSADITAGNAAPHFRTENGNIIKLYQQSSAGITSVGQLVTVLQNLGLLS